MSDLNPELTKLERDGGLDDYQALARTTAVYPGAGKCLLYPVLGLASEVGEIVEKVNDLALDQYDGAEEYELLLTLLPLFDLTGKVASLFKKAHRDKGGTLDVEVRDRLQWLCRQLVAGWNSLGGAAEDVKRIDLPALEMTNGERDAIAKENGGCCWYISAIATELGVTLKSVAVDNGRQLASRAARGKLGGSGDDR
jgi:hypothetical protein